MLPVCPCDVSFSKVHEPDTYDLLRTCRYSILVASSSARSTRPIFSWHVSDIVVTFAAKMLRRNCSREISALPFFIARRHASAVCCRRVSVCPSVCPWQLDILLKRLIVSALHHSPETLDFLMAKISAKFEYFNTTISYCTSHTIYYTAKRQDLYTLLLTLPGMAWLVPGSTVGNHAPCWYKSQAVHSWIESASPTNHLHRSEIYG